MHLPRLVANAILPTNQLVGSAVIPYALHVLLQMTAPLAQTLMPNQFQELANVN